MISLAVLFWMYLLLFGVIGALRGWAKEILVLFSLVLALFLDAVVMKYLPGVKIPIISKKNVKEKKDCLLVLAWNFFDEIVKKNSDLARKFLSIKDLEKN